MHFDGERRAVSPLESTFELPALVDCEVRKHRFDRVGIEQCVVLPDFRPNHVSVVVAKFRTEALVHLENRALRIDDVDDIRRVFEQRLESCRRRLETSLTRLLVGDILDGATHDSGRLVRLDRFASGSNPARSIASSQSNLEIVPRSVRERLLECSSNARPVVRVIGFEDCLESGISIGRETVNAGSFIGQAKIALGQTRVVTLWSRVWLSSIVARVCGQFPATNSRQSLDLC